MAYKSDILEKVHDELNNRYMNALAEHDKRVKEISMLAPEIKNLSDKLFNTSVELTKAIIEGEGDKREIIEKIRKNNILTRQTIEDLLVEFGYPEDYLDIPYTCKKCKDTGFVKNKYCSCFDEIARKISVEELNKVSKIKLHDFAEFRLDYYPLTKTPNGFTMREQMTAVLNYCADYVENFSLSSPSLFFTGGTGLGKTFLSSCITKALTQKGFNVVFDTMQNILRLLENEQFNNTGTNTSEVLFNADLVILDDLGSEFLNNFTSSAIYSIINDRINSGKPMIISTNFNNIELSQKYNERIISRISSFNPIHFEGVDIRQIILKNT